MAEEKSAILPIKPRKVTEEDKKAVEKVLLPLLQRFGREEALELKKAFALDHGLTLTQIDLVILELKRRASLKNPSGE